jgi:hypothetical protein
LSKKSLKCRVFSGLKFAWNRRALEPALCASKLKNYLGANMFHNKNVMMSALYVSMSLLAGVSYADTQTGGASAGANGAAPVVTQPAPVSRDDTRFDCEFFGVFSGKSSGSMRCEARGQYDRNEIHDFLFSLQGIGRGEDDFLRFTCRDRDDKPYYQGPISIGVAPAIVDADGDNGDGRFFNTIITGVRSTSPIIVIQGLNAKHPGQDGSSESSSDERRRIEYPAAVTFNWYGSQVQIPGMCRILPGHHAGN